MFSNKIPNIKEVRLELLDPEYHIKEVFDPAKLRYNISVKVSLKSKTSVEFFIHIVYAYVQNENDRKNIIHTDYISTIEFNPAEKSRSTKNIKIKVEHLAHMLGSSIMMIRGAITQRLVGNLLITYPLPVVNPTELLKEKINEKDGFFELQLSRPLAKI